MAINRKHLLILEQLRSNARKNFTDMSRSIDLPITTIFDNYNKLLRDGVITKHASLVDFGKLGFNYRSFIFIKAKDRDALFDFIDNHASVNSVFKISGYDYMVDAVFAGVKEFYGFMEDLGRKNIIKIEDHDVIECVKSEEFFP